MVRPVVWLGLLCLGLLACASGGSGTPAPPSAPGWVMDPVPSLSAGMLDSDGLRDRAIADPDVWHDPVTGTWHLVYQTTRAATFGEPQAPMVIRHATSQDPSRGWEVAPAPLLERPSNPQAWDALRTETPCLVHDPAAPAARRHKLYYSGAKDLHPMGFPRYGIGVAVSADGTHFTRLAGGPGKEGLLLRAEDLLKDVPGMTDGLVADPEVLQVNGVYHLWCSSLATGATGEILAFGVSHAISTDGITWTPQPGNPVQSLRNPANSGGQQPSVAWNPALKRFEMWLTSDTDADLAAVPSTFFPALGFWRATSEDGNHWQVNYGAPRDVAWRPDHPDETYGLLTGVEVVVVDSRRHLFLTAWGSRQVPPGFVVPLRAGKTAPAVINLLHGVQAGSFNGSQGG